MNVQPIRGPEQVTELQFGAIWYNIPLGGEKKKNPGVADTH